MVAKKKGDFFSAKRSFKESYYPRFFFKKVFQKNLKKGKKQLCMNELLEINKKLTYARKSCRRLDLLCALLIYTSIFKFRSSTVTFIKKRSFKIIKKKVYGNVPYMQIEKNSTKLFLSFFKKDIYKNILAFFFAVQTCLKKQALKNYRKKCFSSLMSANQK